MEDIFDEELLDTELGGIEDSIDEEELENPLLQPENDIVTMEMIIETMSKDFPDFLLVIAEENWIRGYQQAILDIEEGEKIMEEDGFEDMFLEHPTEEEQDYESEEDFSDQSVSEEETV